MDTEIILISTNTVLNLRDKDFRGNENLELTKLGDRDILWLRLLIHNFLHGASRQWFGCATFLFMGILEIQKLGD